MKRRLVGKRITCVLLAVLLFLAGCKTEQTATQEQERIKVTWAGWATAPVEANSYLEQKLEEAFPDIDFEFLAFERETFESQLATRIAGGEVPDIMYRYERNGVQDYVKMGVLCEVPISLVKEHCPNLYAASKMYSDHLFLACNVDGKNYGLPFMNLETKLGTSVNGWRKDWLTNVGITEVPKTLPQMEEALRRFVYHDPDQNGKDDTIGITADGRSGLQCFSAVFGAFGVAPYQWMYQEDGSVRFGFTTNGAKEALKVLARWYKEGLIDQEYMLTGGKVKREKWASGKAGYVDGCTWTRLLAPDGEYYNALLKNNPSAEIALAPAPVGPDGRHGYPNIDGLSASWVFGSHLKSQPQKLCRILQMLDQIASDPALYGLFYGQEGLHWERDEKTGVPVYLAPYEEPQSRGAIGSNFVTPTFFGLPDLQRQYRRYDYDAVSELSRDSNIKDGEDYRNLVLVSIPSEYASLQESTEAVAEKWMLNFIIGANDVETDWNIFLQEWEVSGGTALTNIANETNQTVLKELSKPLE